jgi:DNA-binding MarR family transcriptional regulator
MTQAAIAPIDEALPDIPPATVEPPDLDQAADIGSAILQLVRLYGSIRARVTSGPDGDLSPLFLLVKLAHHGPSRASDLAEQMCADPSTVSRQVSSLVKSGLIERRADPADGRASILVPTELGMHRIRDHEQRRGATVWPVIADWPAQDRDDLLRLISKYTDGIEEHRDRIVSVMLQTTDTPSTAQRPSSGPHQLWKEGR